MSPSTRRETISALPWCRSACRISEETSSGVSIIKPFIMSPPSLSGNSRPMKRLLFALAILLLPPSAYSLSEDVPFVVTPDNATLEMLRLANVGTNDYLVDLGSGDGRIVIVAAKRFG